MPSRPFSASPLSKIVFVKKCILFHAKTFEKLYNLSQINDVFNETVYGYIHASELHASVKKSSSDFLFRAFSTLLDSSGNSTAESECIGYLRLYLHLYLGRENVDEHLLSFRNRLMDEKMIKKMASKGYDKLARSLVVFCDQIGHRATYQEMGEEGYQLIHPVASSTPTMRFFNSNRLAHHSSGEGALVEVPKIESMASSCVMQ